MISALGSILIGALALHLDETAGVSGDEAAAVMRAVEVAIERQGSASSLDSDRSRCGAEITCLAGVRRRTGADGIVLVSVVGGVRDRLVVIELLDGASSVVLRRQAQVGTNASLEALVERFTPVAEEIEHWVKSREPTPAVEASAPLPPPPAPSITPWILLGIGGASFAGGIAVGFVSFGARDRADGTLGFEDPNRLDARSTANTTDVVALALLGASVALIGASIVVALRD